MSDATYADGSCVAPGITLTKTWIVLNTGSIAWTPTTTKVHRYSVSISPQVSNRSVGTSVKNSCVYNHGGRLLR